MVVNGHEAALPREENPGYTEQDAVWVSEIFCRLWRKISYSAGK
jgi:hypothetical protein